MAVDFVSSYVNNCYLYETNDLSANTIKAITRSEVISSGFGDQQLASPTDIINMNGELISISSLCDNISLVEDYAAYCRYTRSARKITRYNFSFDYSILDTHLGSDYATVYLYTVVSFSYEPDGEPAVGGDHYEVNFAKVNGQWCITQVTAEEMAALGITKENFDLQEALIAFKQALTLERTATVAEIPDDENLEPLSTIPMTSVRSYNANNARAYAFTYTSPSYNAGSGNDQTYANSNFTFYSGGNCQNFVSQCVWAGFGGNDTASSINSLSYPMDTTGTNVWHCAGNGLSKSTSWAGTLSFHSFFVNSSKETTGTRMYGETYEIPIGGNFSSVTGGSSRLLGAVLQVQGKDKDGKNVQYGHSLLITAASGTSPSLIRYCGNSPMRQSYRLDEESFYMADKMRVLVPYGIKKTVNCSDAGHTYAKSTTGTSCYCTQCGTSKLQAEGTMFLPVPAGTTKAIQGTTNVTCFRLAIGITAPDGTTKWKEFLSTKSASWSYTFSQKGLYTIQFAARDISDAERNSQKVTHVFKIRVY